MRLHAHGHTNPGGVEQCRDDRMRRALGGLELRLVERGYECLRANTERELQASTAVVTSVIERVDHYSIVNPPALSNCWR